MFGCRAKKPMKEEESGCNRGAKSPESPFFCPDREQAAGRRWGSHHAMICTLVAFLGGTGENCRMARRRGEHYIYPGATRRVANDVTDDTLLYYFSRGREVERCVCVAFVMRATYV